MRVQRFVHHQNSKSASSSLLTTICFTLAALLLKLEDMGNKTSAMLKLLTLSSGAGSQNHQQPESPKFVTTMWPFSAHLPKQLNPGDKIEIEGKLADDAAVFSLNLVCEHNLSEKPHTVAFHHKVLFTENRTIWNSKHNGQWLEEYDVGEADLAPGETFQITLMITEDEIYTYYNGSNLGPYPHRIPIEDVKYLQIWHGIEKIDSIKITFA